MRISASLIVLLSVSTALAEESSGTAGVQQVLLVLDQMEMNLQAQDAAWPTRKSDQEQELAPPAALRKLGEKYRDLDLKKRELVRNLDVPASSLLKVIDTADKLVVVDTLLPLAVKTSTDSTRLSRSLLQAAKRFDPLPTSVRRAMEDVGTKQVAEYLLEQGLDQAKGSLVVSAVKTGHESVIEKIAMEVESKASERRNACLKGLQGLVLVPGCPTALSNRVRALVKSTSSEQARVYFLHFLASCRDPADSRLFREFSESRHEEGVRIAAISALGNFDKAYTSTLLGIFKDRENSLNVRRACVRALGATQDQDALATLIEHIRDDRFDRDVFRALERITGQKLGARRSAWLRWWQSVQAAAPKR